MRVLVVDDSKINIKVAQKMLEHEDIEVDTALSGSECLEKIRNNNYDIIFMDIMMPAMDGVETFRRLKEIPEFKSGVVALTADAKTGAREKYLGLGFDGYIAKPINLEELRLILNKYK